MHILIALLMAFVLTRWMLANFVKLNNVVPGVTGYVKQSASAPVNGTNAVQTLTITATGGTAKLKFGPHKTAAINYNDSAATIQTRLRALPNIGSTGVTVTGTGPFTITFGGPQGHKVVDTLQVTDSTATGGTFSIANTTPGVNASFRNAPLGDLVVDTSTGNLYSNTTAPPNPTWVKTGTQT
jgi:hypothetical protein